MSIPISLPPGRFEAMFLNHLRTVTALHEARSKAADASQTRPEPQQGSSVQTGPTNDPKDR